MKKNSLYTEQINRHVTNKGRRKQKIGFPVQMIVTIGSTILALITVIGISSILSKTNDSEKSTPVIQATQMIISAETTQIEQELQMPDVIPTTESMTIDPSIIEISEESSEIDSEMSEMQFAAPQTRETVWIEPTAPKVVQATKAPETTKPAETAPQPTTPPETSKETSVEETKTTVAATTTPETAAVVETKPTAPSEKEVWGTLYAKEKVNVRSGPGTEYDIVKTLNIGEGVDVVALTENGWYRSVKNTYVMADFLVTERPATTPSETTTKPTPAPTPAPTQTTPAPTPSETNPSATPPPSPTPVDPAGTDLATYARSFLNTPYVYGGGSPSTGFDCSGFVKYIYKNFYGITLTHQSNAILKTGTEVSAADIQVGDVVCYDYSKSGGSDHVAIYIGNGSVIHASNNRSNVIESSFSTKDVVSIRRIIG